MSQPGGSQYHGSTSPTQIGRGTVLSGAPSPGTTPPNFGHYPNLSTAQGSSPPALGPYNVPSSRGPSTPAQDLYIIPVPRGHSPPAQGPHNVPPPRGPSPPAQGPYNVPPSRRSSPPDQGPYNVPPPRGPSPPAQGPYNVPPSRSSSPPDQGPYNVPPSRSSSPPTQGPYNVPPSRSSSPPTQGPYNVPPSRSSSPPTQGPYSVPPAPGPSPYGYPPVAGPSPYGYPPVPGPSPYGYPPVPGPSPYGVPPVQSPRPYGVSPVPGHPPRHYTATWMPIPPAIPNCPQGLEYLTQIDQIIVHQQLELLEILLNFETNNKYEIKNTMGQRVYFAAEQNDCLTLNCCGAIRPFTMRIMDNMGQVVIELHRPFRCDCCCCPFCLQELEVQAPPGIPIGYVKQTWHPCLPEFVVQNEARQDIFKIAGPCMVCNCMGDVNFDITTLDGGQMVGRIAKHWTGLVKEIFTDADNFGIQFPMDLDVKIKAVMLGACFLIDYMFFESAAGSQQQQSYGVWDF